MQSDSFSQSARIQSIDILRGAVIILMAIDHVRVYSGIPAGGPDPAVFFTRWVTHFCAPAFVFLTGTSAYLYGRKHPNTKSLAKFLFIRGIILVILELTLIRFSWTFNFNYSEFTLAGVIWMLGWCMILLSLLIKLKPTTVGIIGLLVIFLQQLFAFVPRALPDSMKTIQGLWEFVYSSGMQPLPGITILYVLVPWLGVMAAGYGFGQILLLEPKRKQQLCLSIGLSTSLLFLLLGSMFVYLKSGDNPSPFIFQLLNQQKYPPSQLFLMMTLGPIIALIPWAEKAHGWASRILATFGRVPFFYYLLHIPLIHISALLINLAMTGDIHSELYGYAPFVSIAPEQRWGLPLLYIVFVGDVAILYFLCRWYSRYKANNSTNPLLKYL